MKSNRLPVQQLGHEIYLLDTEKNKLLCSMLPVAMRDYVFLNKHRSRLANSSNEDKAKLPPLRARPNKLPSIGEPSKKIGRGYR